MALLKALLCVAGAVGYVSSSCDLNPQPDLDRSFRGVLVGGGWRSSADCDGMTEGDKRNTVIVEVGKHSNREESYYQGKSDDDVVSIASGIIMLERIGWRSEDELHGMSDDDQRDTLIVELSNRDDKPVQELQGKSTWDLVQMTEDYYHRSCQVAAILSFTWGLDEAKIASTKPEVLVQQTYDNSQSDIPLQNTFTVSKETSEESSFTSTIGLKFSETATFTAGVPEIASGSISISSEQSFEWSWSKKNTQTTKWENASPVTVPGRKKLQVIAQVTRSNMDIPYHAVVRSAAGNIFDVQGVWYGVDVFNLVVKQIELPGGEELPVVV